MASSSRIPHLLSHILVPPRSSLVLLTSTLGASSSWLLLRFLLNICDGGSSPQRLDSGGNPASRVVLISFLREWEIWRESARRLGTHLDRLCRTGQLLFVDGLTELFGPKTGNGFDSSHGIVRLGDNALHAVQESVSKFLREGSATSLGKPYLLIDGLDLLLAATAATPSEALDTVMEWREHALATIIAASADQPLLLSPSTPLERDHSAFMASLAQQAHSVVGLRPLSTGVAKDISGVIRVTRGAEADELRSEQSVVEEKELLYHVQGDGSVRVFEMGGNE